MNMVTPTVEDFDELLAFLPILYADDFKPILEWRGGNRTEAGTITASWPKYNNAVEAFFSLAARECWVDYEYVSNGAGKMIHDPEAIANASLQEIKSMLTWCVRGERFCDGHWNSIIEDGLIRNVLLRLQNLRPQ